jgi:hypothetical protein
MNRVTFISVLLSLFVVQLVFAGNTQRASQLVAHGGPRKPVVTRGTYALEAEDLSCKSCNDEKCPHWKFSIKKEKVNQLK